MQDRGLRGDAAAAEMKPWQIVIDTNVLVSAFRSDMGASFKLVTMTGDPRWQLNVSTALLLEYEEIVKATAPETGLTPQEADDILDYLAAASSHQEVHFLWRPQLRDPDDEFILELAVECGADFVISYNRRDLEEGCARFGMRVLTPKEFLSLVERKP
jgi:putative PIN family toxin of toxin-antitoxin system